MNKLSLLISIFALAFVLLQSLSANNTTEPLGADKFKKNMNDSNNQLIQQLSHLSEAMNTLEKQVVELQRSKLEPPSKPDNNYISGKDEQDLISNASKSPSAPLNDDSMAKFSEQFDYEATDPRRTYSMQSELNTALQELNLTDTKIEQVSCTHSGCRIELAGNDQRDGENASQLLLSLQTPPDEFFVSPPNDSSVNTVIYLR